MDILAEATTAVPYLMETLMGGVLIVLGKREYHEHLVRRNGRNGKVDPLDSPRRHTELLTAILVSHKEAGRDTKRIREALEAKRDA